MPINSQIPAPETDRRGFLKRALAIVIGGIAGLVPAAAGLMVLLDPLRQKGGGGAAAAVKVTSLAALPPDGVPRKFPVLTDKTDAWNKFNDVPVGAVYLRRMGDDKVEALNVVCPHAGCFVDLNSAGDGYLCPCHLSRFALDGKIADPRSPSPRAMDSLPVEIKNGIVWVQFQNFLAGRPDKVPVA